jgi:hypothetical protein
MQRRDKEIEDATRRAFDRFLELYREFGQHRFHGSADYHDPRPYRGPMFWSEADCGYRLALELERSSPVMYMSASSYRPRTYIHTRRSIAARSISFARLVVASAFVAKAGTRTAFAALAQRWHEQGPPQLKRG